MKVNGKDWAWSLLNNCIDCHIIKRPRMIGQCSIDHCRARRHEAAPCGIYA